MGLLSDLVALVWAKYTQWYYTALVALNLSYKRLTGKEKPRIVYAEPECLKEWNHKYMQLDNIKLHYVEEGPADGPIFLMVHGFPEFFYSWRFQLNHFKKTHRCIALDMRGYYLSEKPKDVEQYNLKYLVADIAQFIQRLGNQKVILAAHDWGAIVCWRTAIEHPELVEKLIICNVPHPFAFQKVFKDNKTQREKSWYVFMFQSAMIPELSIQSNDFEGLEKMFRGKKGGLKRQENITDEDIWAWKYVFSQPDALTGPINFYRQIFSAPKIKKEKAIVQPPVLIVWGDQDAFLDSDGAKESVSWCRESYLYFIKGASHWVQQDEPELVNEIIEHFIFDRKDQLQSVETVERAKL